MTTTQITTHVADGKRRLLFQFRKVGNLPQFLGVSLQRVQALETIKFSFYTARQLQTATGYALEQIGLLVGEPRPAFGEAATDDDVYRALIYARIAINTSHGRALDLYGILSAVGAESPQVVDVYPAAIQVYYETDTAVMTGPQMLSAFEQATAPIEIGITEYYSTDALALAGGSADDKGLGVGRAGKAF